MPQGFNPPQWGDVAPCCNGSVDLAGWMSAHPFLAALIAAGLGFWIGSAVKRT